MLYKCLHHKTRKVINLYKDINLKSIFHDNVVMILLYKKRVM